MTHFIKAAGLAAGLAIAAAALVGTANSASAQNVYRPLTVNPHRHAAPAGYDAGPQGYDPYRGPGAIVTGPVHFASSLAALPFLLVNSVFPAQGNTPLVLIGGPVRAAGQLVQLPFRIAEAPFGGPNPFRY